MDKTYGPTDIQVLTGAQAIRKRPNMYIGIKRGDVWVNGTEESEALTKLILEAMCLARAQAVDGLVSKIYVKVVRGNEVTISWDGPGLTMDKTATGKTVIELLLGVLSACKHIKHENVKSFCENGIVVVNALSDYFYVGNRVDKMLHIFNYKRGELQEIRLDREVNYNGVTFNFIFDQTIFGDLKIDQVGLTAAIEEIKPTTPAQIILEFDN